jgi:myo-inositol-1(or 4)-monophosphatase
MNYLAKRKCFAEELALKCGKYLKGEFLKGRCPDINWKENSSPVTDIDIAISKMVANDINNKFSGDSILTEETGLTDKGSDLLWVCDPLDGTIPFCSGSANFAFSIALLKNERVILGVVYDPVIDRLLVGQDKNGTTLNGKRIKMANVKTIKNGFIDLHTDINKYRLRKELIKKGCHTITCLSSVYGGMLVATGGYIAEISETTNPWDAAALKVIIEEAGGIVTDLVGNEQLYNQPINGFIATNRYLHKQLVEKIHKY